MCSHMEINFPLQLFYTFRKLTYLNQSMYKNKTMFMTHSACM